jgi:hypothetical protein
MNFETEKACKCGKKFASDKSPNSFYFIVPVEGDSGFLAMCDNAMKPSTTARPSSYGRFGGSQTSLTKI